jgi:hypothetical protein
MKRQLRIEPALESTNHPNNAGNTCVRFSDDRLFL